MEKYRPYLCGNNFSVYGATGDSDHNDSLEDMFEFLTANKDKVELIWIHFTNIERVPNSIGDLYKLTELSITYNLIYTLPDTVTQLTNLRKLSMNLNKNITEIPEPVYQLDGLEEFYIYCCDIGYVSPKIGNMIGLKVLILVENPIKELPEEIGNLKKLKKLHIGLCQISKLPYSIGNLESLKNLLYPIVVKREKKGTISHTFQSQ